MRALRTLLIPAALMATTVLAPLTASAQPGPAYRYPPRDIDATGTVNNAWNVTWSQSGTTLQASGVDFNRTLAPGATAEFGFCAAG